MNEYLLDDDKTIIENWACNKNVLISFRKAGIATLKCLEKGAAAKPHSILEKTVKKAEDNRNADVIDDYLSYFPAEHKELFLGLVGHWVDNKVAGLYLTSKGKKIFDKFKKEEIEIKSIGQHQVLMLEKSGKRLCKWIRDEFQADNDKDKKAAAYNIFSCFYTGDYDVHDLLQAKAKVVTKLDESLLKDLKTELIEKRKAEFAPYRNGDAEEVDTEYQRIQHGPQANYIAQMINDNLRLVKEQVLDKDHVNYICSQVAQISTPIYICIHQQRINGRN